LRARLRPPEDLDKGVVDDISAALDGREIWPRLSTRYNYAGELPGSRQGRKVGSRTVRPLGGAVHRRHEAKPMNLADSPLAARSPLRIETGFNYSRLVIEGHGELINATINGALLIFDAEAKVPYFLASFRNATNCMYVAVFPTPQNTRSANRDKDDSTARLYFKNINLNESINVGFDDVSILTFYSC
jgi:hypothetical protein